MAVQLSKWASRFLTPERKKAELVDAPIEPMRDYILDGFSKQFDGALTGFESDHSSQSLDTANVVGAPIHGDGTESNKKSAKKKTPKSSAKKVQVGRYFRVDVTIRCFKCGEVGHLSYDCVNEKMERSCQYCGVPGHDSNNCDNIRCFKCYRPGHQLQNCPDRNKNTKMCMICGQSNHSEANCRILAGNMENVQCMTCHKLGHTICKIPYSNTPMTCCYCAGMHCYETCTAPPQYTFDPYENRPKIKGYVPYSGKKKKDKRQRGEKEIQGKLGKRPRRQY